MIFKGNAIPVYAIVYYEKVALDRNPLEYPEPEYRTDIHVVSIHLTEEDAKERREEIVKEKWNTDENLHSYSVQQYVLTDPRVFLEIFTRCKDVLAASSYYNWIK